MKPGIHPLRWLLITLLIVPLLWAAVALGSELATVVVEEIRTGGGGWDAAPHEIALGLFVMLVFAVFGGASVLFPVAWLALWIRPWPAQLRRGLFLGSFWLIWIPAVLAMALFWHPLVGLLTLPAVGATRLLELEERDAPAPIPRLEDLS